MKEVWFYTYWSYEDTGYSEAYYERGDTLCYSRNYDSFEEAWSNREFEKFPASPVMKGYVHE